MLGGARDGRNVRVANEKTTAPAKISRGPSCIVPVSAVVRGPKAHHQGVISRMIGLSATATATLLDGVIVEPVAPTSGW